MKNESNKDYIRKSCYVILSVLVMGLGLAVLVGVNMGTDPCSCMNLGLAEKLNLSFGNWQLIFNLILFIPILIWGRKYIGLGTVANMVLVGYTADFFRYLFTNMGIDFNLESMYIRIIIMLVALIIFALAASMYMALDMGTAPYDAIVFLIHEKLNKVPFKVVRMTWDFTAILIGYLLGSTVGVVTIGIALLLGPLVSVLRNKLVGGSFH